LVFDIAYMTENALVVGESDSSSVPSIEKAEQTALLGVPTVNIKAQ
jgi:hypothetical protein